MLTENPWTGLRDLTAARIALGRAGHSLPTRELLVFQLAHAKARDAVCRGLDAQVVVRDLARIRAGGHETPDRSGERDSRRDCDPVLLHSAARDRAEYLRRPDLGRRLAPESAAKLERGVGEHWIKQGETNESRGPDSSRNSSMENNDVREAQVKGALWDVVIVIADGLSAIAVERHAIPLIETLLAKLDESGTNWTIAPICVVEQARVAIGDEIGQRLGAAMVLMLIGERPGLSSPDSLGAYLTWSPRVGRTDAERNCVSNIRVGGLEPHVAAVRIAQLMQAARDRQLTGVNLCVPDSGNRVLS